MKKYEDMGVEDLKEASCLIDNALDTLLEIGNGVTHEHIVEAREQLFKARGIIDDYVESEG